VTIDLASIELEAAWLVNLVRTTNNSALLIAHLRAGKEVTPLLADLIADILEGTFKAKPRTMTAVQIAQKFKLTRIVIAAEIDDWKAFLANPSSDWMKGTRSSARQSAS
jgi:translation initiation factor IF-2